MKIIIGLVVATVFYSAAAFSSGVSPWEFGMSPSEVSSFSDFAPYKRFSNGDLETYAGVFDGKKENFQFFFKNKKLNRIGIYFYEGTDLKKATETWEKLYLSLNKSYGDIEVPSIKNTESINLKALVKAVAKNTLESGKTQMAPIKQPSGLFVFSSLMKSEQNGKTVYIVNLYFNENP